MERPAGLPKSLRVAHDLACDIRSGRLAPGARRASEEALGRRFGASRSTVGKGQEELQRRGLIVSRTGIGSFVTYEGERIDSAIGWTRALARGAGEVRTEILCLDRGPDRFAERFLGLGPTEFLRLDRLRILAATGVAISLERSRSPWREAFAATLGEGLPGGSLNRALAEAGLVAASGEEWAEVLPALGDAEARLMRRRPGEPMLQLRRVTRTAAREPIEYVESILDPARFALHLEF